MRRIFFWSFGLLIISCYAINNLKRISRDESTKEHVVNNLDKYVISSYGPDHVKRLSIRIGSSLLERVQ